MRISFNPTLGIMRFKTRTAAGLLVSVAFAACDDSTGPTAPDAGPDDMLTVDAVEDWAFVTLGDPATEVEVGDPTGSAAWDMAFFSTSVMLNGGDAGPGDVRGFCVCDNEDLSDAQVMGLDESSGEAAFEAVTVADVPADEEAWLGDELAPAIDGWWSYDFVAHEVTVDPAAVFVVRSADGSSFAKLHATSITGATQQHAGTVTLELSVQPGAGEPFGPTTTIDVDVSGGAVAVDLETESTVDAGTAGWDLELSGYAIRVNGGISGDGEAGAAKIDTPFEEVTDASELPTGVYAGDAFGGVFASAEPGRAWYRYNLDGNHQIWPTQNVYLIRAGDDVYKVQLTGYYHPDSGDSRHISFRYQRLEP